MARIQVSQQVNANDEQSLYSEMSMLYTELSSTGTEKLSEGHVLRLPELEFDIDYGSTEEPAIQAPSESTNSKSPILRQTQRIESGVAVSRYRRSGVRRCGGLSEF